MSLRPSLKFASKVAGALVIAGAMLTGSYAVANHPLGAPDGFWVTIDDDGTTQKSILKIFTYRDKIYGKVDALLQKPQDTLCKNCKGDLKCKPVKGMLIMSGLQWDGDKQRWSQGRILDPEKGKRYWISIGYKDGTKGQVIDAKGSLDRNGFIGRRQEWRWCTKSCRADLLKKVTETGADNSGC